MAGIGALGHSTMAFDPAREVPHPSRRSLHALDWFVFFVADVQSGFGPFVAVYLTTQKWTQFDIGLVMTVAGLRALIRHVPGGALVDSARSEGVVAGAAIAAIGGSALAYAIWPIFLLLLPPASLPSPPGS